MQRLLPILVAAVALALIAGCGGSSDETTTAPTTGAAQSADQQVRSAWLADSDCRPPNGASRWGCSVASYRCQGVVTGRGWSVSCSKPGKSIAFSVRPN